MNDANPVFVKIEKYKEIMDIMDVVDKKVSNARQVLTELNELKMKEDAEMSKWESSLEEIEHKVDNLRDQFGK